MKNFKKKKRKIFKSISIISLLLIPFSIALSVASCGVQTTPEYEVLNPKQTELVTFLKNKVKNNNQSYIYGEYLGIAVTSLINLMIPNFILANNNNSGWVQHKGDKNRTPLYKIENYNSIYQAAIKNNINIKENNDEIYWPPTTLNESVMPDPNWTKIIPMNIDTLFQLEQATLKGTSQFITNSNNNELIRNVDNAISNISNSNIEKIINILKLKKITFSQKQTEFIGKLRESNNFDNNASYDYGQFLGSEIASILNIKYNENPSLNVKPKLDPRNTSLGWIISDDGKFDIVSLAGIVDYNTIINDARYKANLAINKILDGNHNNDITHLLNLFYINLHGTGYGSSLINPKNIQSSNTLISYVEASISALSDDAINALEATLLFNPID